MKHFGELSARATLSFPFSIFRLADDALTAAGKAKGRTPAAEDAFLLVQDEIIQFGSPPPREDTPGDRRKNLPDPSTALKNASMKDNKSIGIVSKIKSAFPTPVSCTSHSRMFQQLLMRNQSPEGPIKSVSFVILKSLHERPRDQVIVYRQYPPYSRLFLLFKVA